MMEELKKKLGENFKTEKLFFGMSFTRIDTWNCGCYRTFNGGIEPYASNEEEYKPCQKHK